MATFKRPYGVAAARDLFGEREVGLTHPDNPAYIKISDSGSIEAMCGDELGIIIDSYTRTIHIYGDSVVLHTKQQGGLRWNRLSVNHRATKYTEPALVEVNVEDMSGLFNNVDNILGDD